MKKTIIITIIFVFLGLLYFSLEKETVTVEDLVQSFTCKESHAVDSKITALTELTTVADSDIVYIIDDPGGTPLSKKTTVANLRGSTLQAISTNGGILWDDLIDPDAESEIDFGSHISELNVEDFRIGDGGSNYVKFSSTGMTFAGTYAILTGSVTTGDTEIAIQGGTSAADWFGLAAYDLDGTAYKSIFKLHADNAPFITFGDGVTNVVKIDELGTMTFEGTASITLPTDSVNYTNTTGSSKALTPITDDADNFAANFTGANLYGGTFVASGAGTVYLPSPVYGMNFSIGTLNNILVVVEPDTGDDQILDGIQLDPNDSATNLSKAGNLISYQYYDATGWLAWSDGWTDED